MKHVLWSCALTLVLCTGCGMFTPGTVDQLTGVAGPSPFQIGAREFGESFDESPWVALGWGGAGAAALIAALKGFAKGKQAYDAAQAARVKKETDDAE